MKDVQTFIEDRLQKLQTEMLKYEEVVTESRRIQQSNDVLIQEIKAQKQHAERLNEQIKVYQQTEEALKARTVQTERELEDLKELARDHEADPLELEREMIDFRQQLKKAEDDLRQSEGSRQSTEQELANLKVSVNTSVAHTVSDVHKLCFKELEKGALELEGQHVDLMEKHSQCQQVLCMLLSTYHR
jgi:chromosome segregation ATPase